MPADNIQPNQRYLFYAITYLLSTPSYLAQLVDNQGDITQWLQTEADITDSATRNLCIDFINKVKNLPLPYSFMCGTRNSLRVVGAAMPGMYDNPICPTRAESALILKTMSQIHAASAIAPAKQLAAAVNGGNGNGGTIIRHSGHITIALGGNE